MSPTQIAARELFSWLHLSDIHLLQPPASALVEQRLVFDALCTDLRSQITSGNSIRAILVTGDIGYSGAARAKNEYQQAAVLLESVQRICEVDKASVFMIPGNHDVDRISKKDDRNLSRALQSLRESRERIDDALLDDQQREQLTSRQSAYLKFASTYSNPVCANPYWMHRFYAAEGLLIRLVGLNTALLSADGDDRGKLQLGTTQLAGFQTISDNEIVISLSHHPFSGGWLADERDCASWVHKLSRIHLSGHVHQQRITSTEDASGCRCVSLGAGALHDSSDPGSMGYNLGRLIRDENGEIHVEFRPRVWTNSGRRFVADTANCPDGMSHMSRRIGFVQTSHRDPTIATLNTYRASTFTAEIQHPIDIAGLSKGDIAALLQVHLGVHVELLFTTADVFTVILRPTDLYLSTIKRLCLSAATLLGAAAVSKIAVGFYDTRAVVPETMGAMHNLLLVYFEISLIRSVVQSRRIDNSFWESVGVKALLQPDICSQPFLGTMSKFESHFFAPREPG